MSDRYGLSTITTELDDAGVLVATLNRPEHRNAMDVVMHLELKQLYDRIIADEELNAVVLTGAGKYFCVGADFNTMEDNVSYPDGHPGLMIESVAMARNILAVRVPLIAAINGDAIGIGATLALFCDVVYMADHARIADPHVRAAMVAGDGGAVLWPLLMGPNRAKEYLMTGDLVTAPEADRLGLVNHVVPRAAGARRCDGHGSTRARKAGPAVAIRLNKRLVNKEPEMRAVQLSRPSVAPRGHQFFETADHREAPGLFLEQAPGRSAPAKPRREPATRPN
jgi:enoyl-CoA hydratase